MDALEELRRLRMRAYGPAADIDQDPHALQRLTELESLQNEPADVSPGALAGGETAPAEVQDRERDASRAESVTTPSAPETLSPQAPTGDHTDGRASRARRVPLGRGTRLMWSLSVIAAAALAAAITHAAVSIAPVSVSHGARQIATLDPAGTSSLPSGMFGAGPSSLEWEFYGLTLFESSSGYGVPGGECFTAVATEQLPEPDTEMNNWSMNGPMFTGCRVGSFPAIIQMPVDTGDAPEEMRAKFSAGSAVQFVRDGEQIGVYLDAE
jgi:hypothetical protein